MKILSKEEQDLLFAIVPEESFKKLTRDELVEYLRLEQRFRQRLQDENKRLKELIKANPQQQSLLNTDDQYSLLKRKFFGSSTKRREFEPESEAENKPETKKPAKPREKTTRVLLPSERYPNAPVEVIDIETKEIPTCSCCGHKMQDSGLVEESEFLHVIPKQYRVVVQRRHKYNCQKCFGAIVTAPAPARIKEGSAYSDPMIIDVAMSKYCDLIPIERYVAMAAREGFPGIPANSLIECTHYLASYIKVAYDLIRQEVSQASWIHADETTHRMLEGAPKSNWYLWSFSTPTACYFEYHGTRSGDVASELLKTMDCEFLLSDVYSGYHKAVSETNQFRLKKSLPMLKQAFCNAHARRKFVDSEINFPEEAAYFVKTYQKIFLLEREVQLAPESEKQNLRNQMRPFFEEMRQKGYFYLQQVSEKSSLAVAIKYLIKNYDGLTLCLKHSFLPIHNNAAESNLRSSVVGRKTWLGTHSKLGAQTAAILFSIAQSCKLNNVNPREYLRSLVTDLHSGKEAYSPASYAKYLSESTSTSPPPPESPPLQI